MINQYNPGLLPNNQGNPKKGSKKLVEPLWISAREE
jgi:hypothetical protein